MSEAAYGGAVQRSTAPRPSLIASPFNGPALRLLAAALVVVNGFFPAVWILLTSLKSESELVRRPITYLPDKATLGNYVQASANE